MSEPLARLGIVTRYIVEDARIHLGDLDARGGVVGQVELEGERAHLFELMFVYERVLVERQHHLEGATLPALDVLARPLHLPLLDVAVRIPVLAVLNLWRR